MCSLIPNFEVFEKLSTALNGLNWNALDFCKWVKPNSKICIDKLWNVLESVLSLTALASEFGSVLIVAHFQGVIKEYALQVLPNKVYILMTSHTFKCLLLPSICRTCNASKWFRSVKLKFLKAFVESYHVLSGLRSFLTDSTVY